MKIYMIILDGAGDRPISILNSKTPLEYANTPGLDKLAEIGDMAYISVIDPEIIPESDSGTLSLLSYDPKKYYPGRGTLEGLGADFISDKKYSASFRINFSSYSKEKAFLDRRTARNLSDKELQILTKELREKIKLTIREDVDWKIISFGHHRGIISFISDTVPLSGNVSNTDPGFLKKGYFNYPISDYNPKPLQCCPLDNSEAASNTAAIVNEFSYQANKILSISEINLERKKNGKLPANYIIFRDGGGTPKPIPSIQEKYGWSLSIYGQLPSEKAIAKLIGAEFFYTESFELQLSNSYLLNMSSQITNDINTVVYIHLKGPDEPGHDGRPFDKVKAIEKIDKYFICPFINRLKKDDIVIVTCDHSTPCDLGLHSTDNVPLLITAPWLHGKKNQRFNERCAKEGDLRIDYGFEVLDFINEKQTRYGNSKD